MRFTLLSFLLLAACELEPSPKKAPPAPTPPANPPTEVARQNDQLPSPTPTPTAPPTPTPTPAPTPPAGAPNDAGMVAVQVPPDAAMEVKQECVDMAAHLAQVLIDEQKDPTQKAAIEQEKTRMIRRTAEACTRDNWKAETLACFTKASTSEAMEVCAKDLTLKN